MATHHGKVATAVSSQYHQVGHRAKAGTVGSWQSYVVRLLVKAATGASYAFQRAHHRGKVGMVGSWQFHAVATVQKGQTAAFD
jgi:hypothetical protein